MPIKEIPSIPTTKLDDNEKKEIKLFQKIFHALEKLEKPKLPKETLCTHKFSLTNPPKIHDSKPDSLDSQILSESSELIPKNFTN